MASRRERAVVIGVGGIGKFLLSALARFLAYDTNKWELVLVDGDEYEVKNQTRQSFSRLGNKATVTAEELREEFPELLVTAVPHYVASQGQSAHEDHAQLTIPIGEVIQEWDWIFLCVDNHATRKMVSDHIQSLASVRLFSGGNDLKDGNVQVVVRRKGQNLPGFPALDNHHPEIANPADKPPFAMSCDELAQAGTTQLIFANQFAATLMCAAFWAEQNRGLKASEIYFDLSAMTNGTTGPAALPTARQ